MNRRLPIGRFAALAAVLAAAGCGSLRPPAPPFAEGDVDAAGMSRLHGLIALTFGAPVADGDVLVEGDAESTSGSHRGFSAGVLAEARAETWFASFESTFVGLPSSLDLDIAGEDPNQRTEYRHTEICLGAELVRIPAGSEDGGGTSFEGAGDRKPLPPAPALSIAPFVGGRLSRFVVRESPASDGHGEAWADAIVGARVETRVASGVLLRLKGDTLVFGRSDEAWRASAAVVFGHGEVRASAGWEALSVDFEGDTGLERVRYRVLTHGPFVALEIWF